VHGRPGTLLALPGVSALLIRLVAVAGPLAIFATMAASSAGVPLSSEVIMPLGGALASQGRLSLVVVIVSGVLGNLTGALVAYWLSARYGKRLLLGPGRWLGMHEGHLHLADRVFARFGPVAVVACNLLPVVRTYIAFPAGLVRMRLPLFVGLTLLGSVIWNTALSSAGFKLGENYQQITATFGRLTIPLAIALLVLLGVAYVLGRRWLENEAAAGPDPLLDDPVPPAGRPG
jgi:membrane protein DedA with SNARE-associated domain